MVASTVCAASAASTTTSVRSATLPATDFPVEDASNLCQDNVDGFCRKGHSCPHNHDIFVLPSEEEIIHLPDRQPNYLSLDPRPQLRAFECDGPGHLSTFGPRHDNDHVEIKDIQILPTTDEILSHRPPYMPPRLADTTHRHPGGRARQLDINFRQFRYESTEYIIDCCHHASQIIFMSMSFTPPSDYEHSLKTPKGSAYSFFQDVRFEDIQFHELKGVMLRLSFACPESLRGKALARSRLFEEGMLVAVLGLSQDDLSITFMEVHLRQSTEAMRRRTGNDLRGTCAVVH